MIDTHAHYDDLAFDSDRDAVLEKAFSCADRIINIGVSVERSRSSIALAEKYKGMYAAVGIHPMSITDDDDIREIACLAVHDRVVAIGEIGLDQHFQKPFPQELRERQRHFFEAQLELAADMSLPVIIHTRDSWGDTLEILRRYRPKGVVHCFSGSAEVASELISLGMYIGFTGNITYPNAKRANKALSVIPTNRILLETDCPYQAPVGHHGERCDTSMMGITIAHIAAAKGETAEKTEIITSENADILFDL